MDQPKTIRIVPSRFFESFIAVARELIFRPRQFFEQLRPSGSLFGPLMFFALCLFLSALIVANAPGSGLDSGVPPAKLFAALFISWFVSAVLGSLCLHAVLISPLFNARLPYEATLSILAYACIVELVAWIPLLGVIAKFYGLFLLYIGFKAIHQLSARRAAFAVFLAVLLTNIIRLMMLRLLAPAWLDSLIQAIESSGISA